MRSSIICVCLIILFSGCILGSPLGTGGNSAPSTVLPVDPREGNVTIYASEASCDAKTDKYKDLCYINTASTLKDISICDKIQKIQTRELCYGRVGVVIGDSSLCDRISNPSQRGECHLAIEQKGS